MESKGKEKGKSRGSADGEAGGRGVEHRLPQAQPLLSRLVYRLWGDPWRAIHNLERRDAKLFQKWKRG